MINYSEILIIDDMPDQITLFSTLLRQEGFRVFAATSGKAARSILSERVPDLILLDMQVGDLSGFEICRKIKDVERLKDVPIVFVTSQIDAEGISKGFDIGAIDYIKKPFLKEEFLGRIRTQLRVAAQRKEILLMNEELTQFSLAVTHDLKAPFNVINMLINLLKSELGEINNGKVDEIMKLIDTETIKVRMMIERLFEFARMGNITPKRTKIDVKAIFEETYQSLSALTQDRNVKFSCTNLPTIFADEELVRMVIKNLLQNALKYSSKKEKAIIKVSSGHDKAYHVIKVKDNGAGFDMRYVGKIFKVFERLHDDSEFQGTGVGLALVNKIMKKHRGKITAWGEVGKGAEFTLYFPKRSTIYTE